MAFVGPMPEKDRARLEKAWNAYRMAMDSLAVCRGEMRREVAAAIEAGHSPAVIARLFNISRQQLYNLTRP